MKPTKTSFICNFLSRGDQLKVKLANLNFFQIGDGPWFLLFGDWFGNRGRDLFVMFLYAVGHGHIAYDV